MHIHIHITHSLSVFRLLSVVHRRALSSKVVKSAAEAVKDIPNGATLCDSQLRTLHTLDTHITVGVGSALWVDLAFAAFRRT
jgi:hypothetical protein